MVVPASSGTQPRFGRGTGTRKKGRGKGKGRSKGRSQGKSSNSSSSPPPQWGRPDRPPGVITAAGGKPSPICFRCGKKGHLSANCFDTPNAKRKKGADSASVVLGMTPYADDWRKWRESQSSAGDALMAPGMSSGVSASAAADGDDDVNAMLEETKGCAVMDSGATVMCSSTLAAEEIQMQRLNQ